MSRLKKIAKPRTKKKEVVLTIKINFETRNDNSDEAKADCIKFKNWVKDQFTEWDDSMLQYFLYAYNLIQNPEDKYFLDIHIDKIIKDESSTMEEQEEFINEVEEIEESKDKNR